MSVSVNNVIARLANIDRIVHLSTQSMNFTKVAVLMNEPDLALPLL